MSRKEIITLAILGLFFIAGAFFSQKFSGEIVRYLDFGAVGTLVYVLAGIAATVVASVSTVPLIPIAAALWGPFATAILSIVAWGTGSIIAFVIARKYGRPLVAKFADLEKIERYERALEGKYLFWNMVFLRLAVPVDILSYAIGLFASVSLRSYALATFIGITPFAFVFAYAARAPLLLQAGAGLLAGVAVYLGYRRVRRATSGVR